jgi:hypothetical protein
MMDLSEAFQRFFDDDFVENLSETLLEVVRKQKDKSVALSVGWQLIETAPKDGTSVLLCLYKDNDRTDKRFCAVGHYRVDHGLGCWWDDVHWEQMWPPTHWLPLPELPL